MQRLEIIENKVATVEMIENLDKKIHNKITQYGSKVGVTLKFFREKEPIVNEKIDQDSTRIDKLEDIITNLGSAFSAVRNTSNPPPTKVANFMYVPKNKGEYSSKENADLKSISVHPNFFSFIEKPFAKNKSLDFLHRSLIITKKETSKGYKCSVEELNAKDGIT